MDESDDAAAARASHKPGKWFLRRRVVIPLAAFVAAGLLFLIYWLIFLRGYVSTDDAYVEANRIEIAAKILGRIAQLTVDEGDSVAKGQLLAALDSSDLVTQREAAQANLDLALKNVDLAQVNLRFAAIEYRRALVEFRHHAVSQEQYQKTERAFSAALADSAIEETRAKAARAQLTVVLAQLRNTVIVAPEHGVVARRWVRAGDVVQAAQQIYTIFNLDSIWVLTNLEETKYSSVYLGAPVRIRIDAFPRRRFHGTVLTLGASAASEFSLIPPNNASGNFTKVTQRIPLKISIRLAGDDDGFSRPARLLPGMSAEVTISARGM